MFDSIIDDIVVRGSVPIDGDYTDESGFLICGSCHTKKQSDIPWCDGSIKRVPVMCQCRREAEEERKRQEEQQRIRSRIAALKSKGITDDAYLGKSFSTDDRQNPTETAICKDYVEHWDEMKSAGIGILFLGAVRTGKTFLACCIVNALIEKGIPAGITNFAKIMREMSNRDTQYSVIQQLQQFDLLVIDDLGIERNTSFAFEQMFDFIDTWHRSGKPLIVTTNLSMKEISDPGSLERQRIYERIIEMCGGIKITMNGTNRSRGIAKQKSETATAILPSLSSSSFKGVKP